MPRKMEGDAFVQNRGWFCFTAKNYWLVIKILIRSEMFRLGWVRKGEAEYNRTAAPGVGVCHWMPLGDLD